MINITTLQTIHFIVWIVAGILSCITLTSIITYACSKYYYRVYKNLSTKEMLIEYGRASIHASNIPDRKTEIELGEQGTALAYKRAHNNSDKVLTLFVAFTIEHNDDENYIRRFNPEKTRKEYVDEYYNHYIKEYGEAVRSTIEYRIYKYIVAFLQRNRNNAVGYYFKGVIFSPTEQLD